MLRCSRACFSGASLRFITPPGDTPSVLVSTVAARRRPSVASLALKACGISSASASLGAELNQQNGDDDSSSSSSAAAASARKGPGLNAADLTDEEVTRCLQVLPHFVDRATAEFNSAASVRALTRVRLNQALSARRRAVRELRLALVSSRLVATEAEAQALELPEIYERFGETEAVRSVVRRFRDTFLVDAEKQGGAMQRRK
jgi:hypothetical protein